VYFCIHLSNEETVVMDVNEMQAKNFSQGIVALEHQYNILFSG
jgi:hypothetical protein